MTWHTLLIGLYTFCGAASFMGYAPQIWRVMKDESGAASISLTAWGWWSFTSMISVLYAVLIIGNAPLILVSVGNFAGCFITFTLAYWRRRNLAG